MAYLLPEMAKIYLDIRDPSMTFLHRAGVAGLYIQLKYLQQLNLQPPHGLNWSLTAQAIELDWTGKDLDVLQWLFSQSFQIDSDGLIYFPAIEHSLNFKQRLAIHRNLQNSFLQHNQFFKSAGKIVRTEGDREIKYRACASYVHQQATKFLCDGQGNLQSKPIKITGWIYPGTTVQHELVKATTQFTESPQHFLALLFTPLACAHVSISSNSEKQKAQRGIIVPEVIDLENCGQLNGQKAVHYWATGWGDAALRFIDRANAASKCQPKVNRCLIIPFGTVAWSKQQQTRLAAETVEVEIQHSALYRTLCQDLKQDDPFAQFIAENLIRGKPWWWEFANVFIHKKAYLTIRFRQNQLNCMLKKTEWDTEAQEMFVLACHQGLRITFGKIGGKTKEGDYPQFERKVIQLRSNLERCQNAAAFRDFITAFWGNAGNIEVLQNSWQKLLPLTTGQSDWKMAKSLFFLALASYKGEEKLPDPDKLPVENPSPAITAPEVPLV